MINIMNAFDAYKMFTAIKLHFNSPSYDYFKYRGSVRTNESKFECRNDKYFYHKLSKKKDLELFLASNLFEKNNLWVGNLFEDEYNQIFKQAQKRQQSLAYTFESDISQFDSLDEAFVVKNGNYPKILNAYKRKEASPETIIILNDTCNMFRYWDEQISDKVLWPKTKQSLLKYASFLNYDKSKYRQLLTDKFQ